MTCTHTYDISMKKYAIHDVSERNEERTVQRHKMERRKKKE